jgi:hypothetical protein
MEKQLYNPFDKFSFDNNTCFLSGHKLDDPSFYPVFPEWILKEHNIGDQPFKMLDESYKNYSDLKLPCSSEIYERLSDLDERVRIAFEKGYVGVKELDKITLFQWISKWVYGIIFNEIQVGIKQQLISGEDMNFSQTLVHKFKNLHAMLQSLIEDVEYETVLPFSILLYVVENPDNTYNYRDEINTLVYSLRIKNLGIIACLQDNGANLTYHEEILSIVKDQKLHPIQFEELCGRFFYSCYLFNRLPDYMISTMDDRVYIEPMSLLGVNSRPIFDNWQAKTYGQVIENFWKPWGYTLFEIIKDPENPMSFIKDSDQQFIPLEEVKALLKE